jgi:hypothetical protein
MLPTQTRWRPLRREVPSVTLDPLTQTEIRRGVLPAGTLIENVDAVLQDAMDRQLESVVVRARDGAGWTGFERIALPELCVAIT